jgi:hypothetical protein
VAARRDGFPCKGKAVSGGNRDLQLHQIEAGHLFGDGVLHLQPRIHFEKIEIVFGINQKFDGACIGVAARTRQPHSCVAHAFA